MTCPEHLYDGAEESQEGRGRAVQASMDDAASLPTCGTDQGSYTAPVDAATMRQDLQIPRVTEKPATGKGSTVLLCLDNTEFTEPATPRGCHLCPRILNMLMKERHWNAQWQ